MNAESDARIDALFARMEADPEAFQASLTPLAVPVTPPSGRSLSFVCPTELAGRGVPQRQFIVDGWLSPGHVTVNFGDGGTGKTLLAQQLMTSCATGTAWCGLEVRQCRSIALFCEDDEDELHRRQALINGAYGIDYGNLADMKWASGVGEDNTLVDFHARSSGIATLRFHQLRGAIADFGARLVVIDTAADTFGGNENVRREVRKFVGAGLGQIAHELNCAILLNAHPSRAGMGQGGDGDGGSTAWSNTVRSRWSLERVKNERIQTEDRILTRRKANYAPIGENIRLRWCNGVLVHTDGQDSPAAVAQQAGAEAVFLKLLARLAAEGRFVSAAKTAHNYAPRFFVTQPDRQRFSKLDFEHAMDGLFATRRILIEEYGRTSDRRARIAAVASH